MSIGYTIDTSEGTGFVIKGDLIPSLMEIPFTQRLDNVRSLLVMIDNPRRMQQPPMPGVARTGDPDVLIEQIGSYVDLYYSGLADQIDLEKLKPGDLVQGKEDGTFVLQLLFGAQVKIWFGNDRVYLELACPRTDFDAILHCASTFTRLTDMKMSDDDLN